MSANLSHSERLRLLWTVVRTNPKLVGFLLVLSLLGAALEGVGLSFILPVLEVASPGVEPTSNGGRLLSSFVSAYETLGVPFVLEYIIVGVTLVMAVRFGVQFLVAWLEATLEATYVRDLRVQAFDSTLETRIQHLDDAGSDELLNAIITQVNYHSNVVPKSVQFVQKAALGAVYLGVALYLAPELTLVAGLALGVVTYLIHWVLKPAYTTGGAIAEANERIQNTAQTGILGARDVRLFGLRESIRGRFADANDAWASTYVQLQRNRSLLTHTYLFAGAATVFGLIYIAIEVYSLSIGSFAVFLFAMFRLAPTVGSLGSLAYSINGELPHLVRTEATIRNLEREVEPIGTGEPAPNRVDRLDFDGVTYSYPDETVALRSVSFTAERGETIAFVGPSGAGKSTIVSLLTRFYDPTEGRIRANGHDLTSVDIDSWRSKVAVVRQDPFLFNDTLRFNIAVGQPDVCPERLAEVCEVTRITEFLPRLPAGLETVVGDDGVRLSGGQRQRVALARALLMDTDILVLDEATSNLDATLEREVHEALDALDRDQITLVIAHRLSTIANADRIYTIVNGEPVEVGTHEELLTREGAYATLYAAHAASP